MTVLLRILGRLFRIALYGLALCVVLLLAAVAFVGFTDTGARMAMSYVEKLVSTPERTVVLGDPSGLLTGRLRIGSVVLGDRKGTYAEIRDVAVDWSPLSLAFLEFKAQLVSAGSVSLLRLPEPVAEATASSSSGTSFLLPVEVRVGSVDMPKILIGEDVLGREQELRLSGSGSAGANYVALKVALSEQARPDARVNADILFNPAGNELRLDADIAEPQGGILATLLRLPGEPAVGIRLTGEGPLSAWGGRLSAGLDGQEVLSLDGRHDLSTAGLHTISLHGGGAFEGLMPPQLRSLMAGTTAIDVVAAFEGTDLLRIEKGDISTGAFTLKASGTARVKGANDLDVALSGTTQPIDLRLPLSGGEARFVIDGATISLTGPAEASALDVAATVLSVEMPQGRVEDVSLSARSPAFDLAKRSGTVNVLAETGATAFTSEDVNRAIKGPVKIAATLGIAPEQILFEPVTIESATLGGTITGRHDLWTGATDATFKLFALPAVLPENLSTKFGTTISAEGRVAASSEGAIDLQDFQLKSDALEAAGRASLKSGTLDAVLSGRVPEINRFLPQAKGAASFEISAAGNLDAPQVKGAIRSAGVALAGRTLANLAIDIDGKADRRSPAGEVSVSGELDGQQINLRSSVTSSSGQISMPVVEATIGTNTVKGALALGADFLPEGTLQFAFPDVGLLASLAGQSATGDLAGTVTFARAEGRTGLMLNAAGSNLARENVTVTKPVIDVTMEDLRALAATGIIRADGVTAGENDLQGPVVEFNHQGDVTGFKVSGRYENAPLATEGSVSQLQGVTTVALNHLEATVKGYPLRLTEATSIAIRDGAVNFDNMTIDAGIAEAEVSGTFSASGESDLRAYLSRAGGPIDLKFPVDGGEASLAIESANVSMAGKMQSARLDIAAKLASAAFPQGSIANAELAVESASFNILEQSGQVTASVKVGETQFVNADLARALPGPVTLDANLSVQPSLIGFDEVALASAGANAKASGSFAPPTGVADVTFELTAPAEALPAAVASKFDTPVSLEGRLKRAQDGAIEVSAAKLKSGTLDASGSAKLANGNLEASVSGTLPALGKLLADAEGKATFEATATGPLAALGVKAQVVSSGAKLAGRTLSDLVLTVDGKADPRSPSGTLTATGALDGQAINIKSDVVSKDGRISIPVLEAKVGPNILKGAVTLGADYLPVGNVTFEFPDIGLLAAMAGQRASGDLAGSAVIENTGGKTALTIKASGKGISRDALKVVNPSIDLRIADLQTAAISGEVRTDSIVSGSNRLERLKAKFTREGNETIFDVAGQYDGAPLVTRGTVQQAGDQLRISLASFEASPRRVPIRLSKPTTFTLRGGDLALDGITIGAGNGTIAVSGAAGQSLNLALKLTSLPASLANTFSAGLGAEGTIGGTVTVKGTPAQPNVAYQLQWQGARTSQTAAAGVGPLQIGAQGGFANNQVRLDLTLSGSGLSFKGGGTVGVTGNMPLSLKLSGTVPFDLIQDRLAAQGFSLTGNAAIDLSISGAAKSPVIAGTISTSGGRLVDVRRNLAVNDLTARISLDGRQATIQQLSGRLATGGRISATGTVGIAPGSGYPANVAVTLTDLTYVDGTLVTANVAGDLTLKGPILTGLVIGGEVRIRRAGITIPEKLPATLSEIDIRHRNAPPAVLAMVKALEQVSGGGDAEGRGVGLDLKISAPRQIFVRGRGVDAELGGDLTIRGNTSNPSVSGAFTLKRGRLEILARRLDFTSGTISFGGGLIPTLNLVATSTAGSTTITVTVAGQANSPTVEFSSSPALPQDEVLAQLIFNRSMSNLSAVQIAQLAAAASQLAGGPSGGLFSSLRSKLGVDDLDISTDAEGRAQVTAGKYLNKRTYLEVTQDPESGGAEATINLDVGRGVKLRGQAGSSGSGAGIFYEREY